MNYYESCIVIGWATHCLLMTSWFILKQLNNLRSLRLVEYPLILARSQFLTKARFPLGDFFRAKQLSIVKIE